MNEPHILEMKQITKRFPGVVALKNVTFEVRRGTIHGLVGENGAGKSTLMKILSGTYPVGTYEGKIFVNGRAIQLRSTFDALEQGIGIVPQEVNVVDQLTVAENVVIGKWTSGGGTLVSMREINRRVRAFLDEYHISLNPSSFVYRLTAAEKQLVMIARALYRQPNVLILDEPTSSLALEEIDNLFARLEELRQKGLTCVFITHKLTEILQLTDRTTVLRDGEVTGQFERGEYSQNSIISAMVGRKIDQLYPTRDTPIGTDTVLQVEHLTVPHPNIAAPNVVEDISFSLRSREILGLAGLVGSGRSETVNAIIGRLPSTGRVLVHGKPVHVHDPGEAKGVGIALITEDRKRDGLLTNLELRPNVTLHSLNLFSRMALMNPGAEHRLALDSVRRFNIKTPSVEQMVVNLSGGNQQKVILAKVLMAKPEILLMDEPTKGVDIGAKNEIYKLMLMLVAEGISIIMISSELPELLAMCDRFVVLAEGRVADEFPKSEASEHRVMLAATQARHQVGARAPLAASTNGEPS
ncbi:MAG: sugar ABC transporter ATP-binding protein [Chloroflexi bacterium]|nr:sugar ABC transporter ATP-binding protein [Chloroflexota bacterium]